MFDGEFRQENLAGLGNSGTKALQSHVCAHIDKITKFKKSVSSDSDSESSTSSGTGHLPEVSHREGKK